MSNSVVAKRYARALVDLGREHDRIKEYGQELTRLVEAFTVEPRLGLLLESPSLAEKKKKALVGSLAEYLQLTDHLRNFLQLLLERQRLRLLPAIAEVYRDQADAARGLQRARVTSAIPLDKDRREALLQVLSERCGARVVLEEEVVPELLGGMRVQLGNQILDGSVRGQLRRLAGTINKG